MINLNTKIRVHRILTSIARYQNATPEDDAFVKLFDGREVYFFLHQAPGRRAFGLSARYVISLDGKIVKVSYSK